MVEKVSIQGRLRLDVPARHVAALGRDGGARRRRSGSSRRARRRWGTCSSMRITPPATTTTTTPPSRWPARSSAAQHPSGGWNYIADFAGERVAARVVRHHRQERLAAGGVPALLGQRHVRRRRHRRVGEVPPAPLRREEGPEVQAARSTRRSRSSSTASIRSASGRSAIPLTQRVRRMHGMPDYTSYRDLQRRRGGREHRFPAACATRRSAIARLLDPIIRGMNAFIVTQHGPPQPGWGAAAHARPAAGGARTYEPKALVTHTTGDATSSC